MPASLLSVEFILPFLLAAVFANFIIWMWTFKRAEEMPLSHLLPQVGFYLVSLWGLLAAITALDLHTQSHPNIYGAGAILVVIVHLLRCVCKKLSAGMLTE